MEGVSLSVSEGEFVGVVGPNGAGKTTLLQTINGVLTPDAGTVTVGGLNVHEESARAVSRRVATVPQEATVGFEFSVADIVEMGRTPYASRFGSPEYLTDHRYVQRALDRTDTAQFADRSIREVSGGERQRVLLARALAQDAPTLVLDEPTASLDVNHQVRTLSLVADLVAEGKTAIAAIHDLDLAARFCDRLLLLSDGSLVARGSPETVLDSEYLDAAFETTTAVGIDPVTGTPSVTAMDDSCAREGRVHVVGSGAIGARVLSRLHQGGFDLTAGPLPRGDLALETARGRDVETIAVRPFEALEPATERRLDSFVDEAAVTVVADPPLDPSGAILDATTTANTLVVVDPESVVSPMDDEDTAQYDRLRERGVVTDTKSVLETVVTATAGQEVSSDD
nr:ATP-binding cassette domain-containing protein [Halorientalis brevis]